MIVNEPHPPRAGVRIALAALVGSTALLAASCGGGSSQTPQEKWAADVCGAVSNWKTSMTSIATDFSGGISKDELTQKADEAQQATHKLADQLKAIGPPQSQAGNQAKSELDQFANTASSSVDSIKTQAQSLTGKGLAGFTAGVAQIATDINTVVQSGRTTLDNVKKLDPKGELQTAIQNDATCQSLGGQG